METHDCPRCGGALDRYSTDDAEKFVCADCGYAGVPVEHTRDTEETESWEEALDRFEKGS